MKKITAVIIAILLSSVSIVTIAFAKQQQNESQGIDCIGGKCIIPYPRSRYPDITVAQGVGVDKSDVEAEPVPVVFLAIKYNGEINYFLISDSEFYSMDKIYERYDWETGTKIFQYESNGDAMTVVIQQFYSQGIMSISGDFKGYLITFEPINKYGPKPVGKGYGVTKVTETVTEQMSEETGINIQDILKRPTKSIAEWNQ